MNKKSSMNVRTAATGSKIRMKRSAIRTLFISVVIRGLALHYQDIQQLFTHLQRALMTLILVGTVEKISLDLAFHHQLQMGIRSLLQLSKTGSTGFCIFKICTNLENVIT